MEHNKTHSENAEMYLVSIAMLQETGGPSPIPIPRLAEEMDIQTVSANQMVRKLEEEGLVTYQPYKGVSFTPAGSAAVELILRNRRLWEVFFVQELKFSPVEADALACRMEHITQPEVADRLSEFLGHPTASPSGRRIPDVVQAASPVPGIPLIELQPGQQAEVLAVNLDNAAGAYLRSEGLIPGTTLVLLASSSAGAVLVEYLNRKLTLAADMAARVVVALAEEPKKYAV
jgi:DtxR family Mn-dependent transcriptional regulator